MEAYKTLKARHDRGETSWLTKDSGKWMSFVPGETNCGVGPTGASHVPTFPYPKGALALALGGEKGPG